MAKYSFTEETIFIDGVPAEITVEDWRRHHLQSFPVFAEDRENGDEIIREAIESVYTMFPGVSSLWAEQDKQIYYEKTRLCYRLLVCWYIADLYPDYSRGILSTAGLPLVKKKIGQIDIIYDKDSFKSTNKDLLAPLLSNSFGAKAHLMIKNAVSRLKYRNGDENLIRRIGDLYVYKRSRN